MGVNTKNGYFEVSFFCLCASESWHKPCIEVSTGLTMHVLAILVIESKEAYNIHHCNFMHCQLFMMAKHNNIFCYVKSCKVSHTHTHTHTHNSPLPILGLILYMYVCLTEWATVKPALTQLHIYKCMHSRNTHTHTHNKRYIWISPWRKAPFHAQTATTNSKEREGNPFSVYRSP